MSDTPDTDPTDTWHRVDAILRRALELDSTEERLELIESLCCDDQSVRDEVLALLASDKDSELAMSQLLADRERAFESALGPDPETGAGQLVGSRIGNYRITELIATGGMGAVYLARRDDGQFKQTVAIKVLPTWAANPQMISRLRAERQILSSLQHPNITQLLSGGETADGFPYLVTEYIDGSKITDFVDTNKLSLQGTLKIFCEVAEAVHHAHTQLVVHRDIKPSNILVDKDGRPHLLDFGIAKLLDPASSEITVMHTAEGFSPMTLQYASPEQRNHQPITTASDVYQLGLLLYRLLTGQSVDFSNLAAGGMPRRPSNIADSNAWELRGDLDTIVLKALRVDPNERYASASELASDIQRYLNGQAIVARRESPLDVTRRLARRNPFGAFAVAALAALLLVWIISLNVYSKRLEVQRDFANSQAERASRVKQVLADIYSHHDPLQSNTLGDKNASMLDSLDLAVWRVDEQLQAEPDIQAELYGIFSSLYMGAGQPEPAIDVLYKAEEIYQSLGEEWKPELATIKADLAGILINSEKETARVKLNEALALIPMIETQQPSTAVEVLLRAAIDSLELARRQEALVFFDQAQLVFDRHAIDNDSQQIEILFGLAKALIAEDRLNEAEPLLSQALALTEQNYGPDHARLTGVLDALSSLERNRGNLSAAVTYSSRAVGIMRKGRVENYDNLLTARSNLALALAKDGQLQQSIEILQEVTDTRRDASPRDGNAALAITIKNLATVQHMAGYYDEALANTFEAQKMMENYLPEDSAYRATPHFTMALIYLDTGRPQLAGASATRSLHMLLPILGEHHYQIAVNRCVLGEAKLAEGDIEGARELIEPAYQALKASETSVPRYERRCEKALAILNDK